MSRDNRQGLFNKSNEQESPKLCQEIARGLLQMKQYQSDSNFNASPLNESSLIRDKIIDLQAINPKKNFVPFVKERDHLGRLIAKEQPLSSDSSPFEVALEQKAQSVSISKFSHRTNSNGSNANLNPTPIKSSIYLNGVKQKPSNTSFHQNSQKTQKHGSINGSVEDFSTTIDDNTKAQKRFTLQMLQNPIETIDETQSHQKIAQKLNLMTKNIHDNDFQQYPQTERLSYQNQHWQKKNQREDDNASARLTFLPNMTKDLSQQQYENQNYYDIEQSVSFSAQKFSNHFQQGKTHSDIRTLSPKTHNITQIRLDQQDAMNMTNPKSNETKIYQQLSLPKLPISQASLRTDSLVKLNGLSRNNPDSSMNTARLRDAPPLGYYDVSNYLSLIKTRSPQWCIPESHENREKIIKETKNMNRKNDTLARQLAAGGEIRKESPFAGLKVNQYDFDQILYKEKEQYKNLMEFQTKIVDGADASVFENFTSQLLSLKQKAKQLKGELNQFPDIMMKQLLNSQAESEKYREELFKQPTVD